MTAIETKGLKPDEIKENARLYAESKMWTPDWDRRNAEFVGIFYKHFIDYLFSNFPSPIKKELDLEKAATAELKEENTQLREAIKLYEEIMTIGVVEKFHPERYEKLAQARKLVNQQP